MKLTFESQGRVKMTETWLYNCIKNCNPGRLFFNINNKDKFATEKKKIQDADDLFLSNLTLSFTIFQKHRLHFCIQVELKNFPFALF